VRAYKRARRVVKGMPVLLYIVGAIAIMAGAAMIGFGIPINEFSFGNTLISAGVTAFMSGLVILGLGAVVAQLHRVAEALAARPLRAPKALEPFEPATPSRSSLAARVPFPPKPKLDLRETVQPEAEPVSHELPAEAGMIAEPHLPNPAEAHVEATDFPSTSPNVPLGTNGSGAGRKPHEPLQDAGWRAPRPMPPAQTPQTNFFESMWPAAEPRQPKMHSEQKFEAKPEGKTEGRYEAKSEFGPEPGSEPESDLGFESGSKSSPEAPREPETAKTGERRAVAILKSGVVDGMGYTLYVDGSIEAELPQGTLRFASINELRSHLEKHS